MQYFIVLLYRIDWTFAGAFLRAEAQRNFLCSKNASFTVLCIYHTTEKEALSISIFHPKMYNLPSQASSETDCEYLL